MYRVERASMKARSSGSAGKALALARAKTHAMRIGRYERHEEA